MKRRKQKGWYWNIFTSGFIFLKKKQSKRMFTRKLWDHVIEMKREFVLRKEKVYQLLKEEK